MIRDLIGACGGMAARRPVLVVVVVALISGAAALALPRLKLGGGVHDLFSTQPGPSADLALHARAMQHRPELVLLVSGPDRGQVQQAARRLAGLLRASPLVAEVSGGIPRSVFSGALGRSMVALADPEATRRMRRRLGPGAAAQARKLRRAMLSPFPPPRELITRDPMGLGQLLLGGGGVDRGSGLYASADGKAALIFARPGGKASDLAFCGKIHDLVQGLSQRLAVGGVRVQATGAYLYAHHLSRTLQRDLMVSSNAALLGAVIVLFLLLRSFRLLPVAVAVSGVAVVWTLALAALTVGRLNALSLCFAALCIGMGMDAMIHVTTRARELWTPDSRGQLIPAALASVGPALLAASVTTMAAFATFGLSSFAGFSQTGLLATCGLGLTLALTVTLFPALATLVRLQGARQSRPPSPAPRSLDGLLGRLSPWVQRHRWPVLVVALALGAGAAVVAPDLRFSEDLTALAPAGLPPSRADRQIAEAFGRQRSRLIVLARGPDLERVLQANDRVAERLRDQRRRGLVTDFASLAALLPSRATQQKRIRRWLARDPADLVRMSSEALAAQGLRPELFADFFRTLLRPRPLTRSDLPPALAPLIEQHLARLSGQWLASTVVHRARERGELGTLVSALEARGDGVQVSVTGAALAGPETARLLRQDLLRMGPLALAAVLLVVGLLLRRPGPVLATMASIALTGLLFTGAMALLGLQIDLYNLMVLPVVIGYGVDDHIYVVRRAREDGLDAAVAGSGRAVITTTLTTMAAFGALTLCTLPGLRSLGLTAVLGVGLGLVTSLVVMPALLSILAAHGRRP